MMKKLLFVFGLAFISAISISSYFNIPYASAQIFEYKEKCDIASQNSESGDGIINEYDLKKLDELITAETVCPESPEECLCDSDLDGDCDKKDLSLCKTALGSTNSFSSTNTSYYPNESNVLDLNLSKEAIKDKIINNSNSLTDDNNIANSSWFENYYNDFKYVYSKIKYLDPLSYAWADLNNNSKIDKFDAKIIKDYRKKIKKTYGQKNITEAKVYELISYGTVDLNEDGAINSLDKKIANETYKTLRLFLKGKISEIDTNNFNFNSSDESLNEGDLNALKSYIKSMRKYNHIFNYSPADVKAKILENDFDLNNDNLINKTDQEIASDYRKKLKKMQKNSSTDPNYGYYNLNSEAENTYELAETVDKSDLIVFTQYYIKLRQHSKYGKITYKTADDIAPFIYLKNETSLSLEKGKAYKEPGYSAWDNRNKDLTKKVEVTNDLDINTPGTYTITYTVVDDNENSTSVARTITVTGTTEETNGETTEETNGETTEETNGETTDETN